MSPESLKMPGRPACRRVLLLLLAALVASVLSGCGGGGDSTAVTAATSATISNNTQASGAAANPSGNSAGGGEVPVMPNLSEADVSEVTAAATSAYRNAWSDGSGIDVVWGPNIVSGWAILGMENFSGANAKDILLQKEAGAWVVRDMGNGLAGTWRDKTPVGLWP